MLRKLLVWTVASLNLLPSGGSALGQAIRTNAPSVVSGADGGWYPWYEIHADPDDPTKMMVCGARMNATNNALHGVVYYSSDAGKNWALTLEDKNSAWVSEESCAYGTHGVSYFVADASEMINEQPHHELGKTRIYVSRDHGRTWTLGTVTGWTDYSTAVVDTAPGLNQNRLYVFFNDLSLFYKSIGKGDLATAEWDGKSEVGTRVGMISYKVGETEVSAPVSNSEMGQEHNRGSFPSPALMLRDDSILAFYSAKRQMAGSSREFSVEAIRTARDRTTFDRPVKLAFSSDDSYAPTGDYCGVYVGSAAAYDPVRGFLYYAYPELHANTCRLFLISSLDDGKSWSKPRQVVTPGQAVTDIYMKPAIAVNGEGTIALMWENRERSGCWLFTVSTDEGVSFSRTRQFGTCSEQDYKPSQLSTAYLWTSISQADQKGPASPIKINLRNTRNGDWRDESAIAVATDGSFHPVWIDTASGQGRLETVAIHVKSAKQLIDDGTRGLKDVTKDVVVLYGGVQHFDPKSKTITLSILVKNSSSKVINAPFKLAVPALSRDSDYAEIANAQNGVSEAGAVWDISSSIWGRVLPPAVSSKPYLLKFHYLVNETKKRSNDGILGFEVKVFAGGEDAVENRP